MSITNILADGAAVVGIGGVVFFAGRFTESVRANTKATDKLSDVIDSHMTWSAELAREVAERLHGHDTRLTVVEADVKALKDRRR